MLNTALNIAIVYIPTIYICALVGYGLTAGFLRPQTFPTPVSITLSNPETITEVETVTLANPTKPEVETSLPLPTKVHNYSSLNLTTLRQSCKIKGLPTSGNKKALANRLKAFELESA